MSELIYDPIAEALDLNPIEFDSSEIQPTHSISSFFIGKRNPAYGYKWTEEQRKNISERRKELGTFAGKNNPMYGKSSKGMSGKKHTNESKKKMSESAKKRGSNRTGVKHTEQQKMNIREGLAKRPLLTCPHCGLQSKHSSNMSRYHFDNCKKHE